MSRARNIKPGFFKNEDLAECTLAARLCFAGLWTLADREGRLEDRPKRIKGELFPFDNFDVEPLLCELERFGFIHRYEADGLRLVQVIEFKKHQTPHYSEKASLFKPPVFLESVGHDDKQTPGGLPEDSEKEGVIKRGPQPPDSLIPDSLNPDTRKKLLPPSAPPAAPAAKGGSKRGARLPTNWVLPKAWGDWAVNELGLTHEQVRSEGAKFRDYWHAKAGRDAAKLDWLATWRNWARTAAERAGVSKPANGHQGSQSQLVGGTGDSVLTDEERENTRAALEQFL